MSNIFQAAICLYSPRSSAHIPVCPDRQHHACARGFRVSDLRHIALSAIVNLARMACLKCVARGSNLRLSSCCMRLLSNFTTSKRLARLLVVIVDREAQDRNDSRSSRPESSEHPFQPWIRLFHDICGHPCQP